MYCYSQQIQQAQQQQIKKKPINKRTQPIESDKLESDNFKDDKSLTSNRVLTIKAKLRTENTATFLDEDDYFYKYLKQRHKEHLQFIEDDKAKKKYYQSYSASGFKFKACKKCIFLDAEGQVCMPEQIIDKTCTFTLQVIPYSNDVCSGLVLRTMSVKLDKSF